MIRGDNKIVFLLGFVAIYDPLVEPERAAQETQHKSS